MPFLKFVLKVSMTARPRFMAADVLVREVDARSDTDPTFCMLGGGSVGGTAHVVSEGSLSQSFEENELTLYESMVVALHCLHHGEWESDISVDGSCEGLLEAILTANLKQFGDYLTEKFADQGEEIARRTRAATERATGLVNCQCMTDRLEHFDLKMRHTSLDRSKLN